ncbi:MAG: hypothetical protein K2H84_03770, partial [Paramuribaculum sp.]|nr:hypothetical protein [Paramuribaculum sp.]
MHRTHLNKISATLTAIIILFIAAGCSTTRRIADDEILYTGVKKIQIETPKGVSQAPGLASDVKDAVNVAPNNSLISPYIRYPFPLGLWVYNNWSNPPKGFRHWIYEKLVAEPVLISDVRPEVRTKMIDEILDNNGYFRGSASYELIQGKNKKKASILYKVETGPEYLIDSVQLLPDTCHLNHMIDSISAKSTYLRAGSRYCTDSLSTERIKIANFVRNRGYYFFKPDYIEYLADSTINPERIAIKMVLVANAPKGSYTRWRTGTITTRINRNKGGGTPDTIETPRGTVIQMMPSRLRRKLIPECITFRQGKIFSVRDMNRTQTYLSRTGIFNNIEINAIPDTASGKRVLDVLIDCTFDAP